MASSNATAATAAAATLADSAHLAGGESSASQEQLDRIVLGYLKRKGYRLAEDAFKREARLQTLGELSCELQPGADASIPNYVLYYSQTEQGEPGVYRRSFDGLRRWLDTSLDMYRPELRATLFPVFAHVYLEMLSKGLAEEAREFMQANRADLEDEHPAEMQKLGAITLPQHLQESEFAQMLLAEKYNLRMTGVALRLLVSFLLDQKHMLLLRVVSQRLNIQVAGDHADSTGADIGVVGQTGMQMDGLNQQPVQLAKSATNAAFREEVERALQQHDATLKDSWREVRRCTIRSYRRGLLTPLPIRTTFDVKQEVERIKDLAKQIALGPGALPSICCYTVHNTNDSLNCMAFSDDLSTMACGFSESYVKLWSLTGQPLRDLERARETTDAHCRKLIGHSGPVFGASFSPDGRFLVTASEDSTARLWSLDTYSNVVCYRGHNYPVWDVEFGPYGTYFATASHDRTARLWSCEHPYPLRVFAGHLSDVDCLRFHPNSRYLLTGSSDQTVRMWDVQHGQCVRIFKDHCAPVTALATSMDGRLAASAGADKIIRLWDLGSGNLIKRLHGHEACVYSLSFNAEGNILCSGGADNVVRVWDVVRENELRVPQRPSRLSGKGGPRSAVWSARSKAQSALTQQTILCSADLLGSFPTKSTPIYRVQFTRRNLAVVGGAFMPHA
ncbi:WD40-repeat-containing domain protein [Thamnocephalis sphaerospora]|uniref:WD40-repeat-containing domain protein n=1 Tax=Thamnocephalis sphaerospora TaxID=78915 RepID=A0A4P9XT80_9FUNG|nr:WD40-repeat-containing domain protein [Thamnocephalis sphaerospora]|eukprot:RKP09368.1 WD40-repeat-containing domain protein [Thamnocephalis sphaerospora]